MSVQAESYFSQMTKSVPEHDWQQWEREITDAESRRLDEPAAMDILGAKKISNEDTSMPHDEDATYTSMEKWIQMALDVEEKQCVIYLSHQFSL